jgi:hypothetical protein
MKRSASLMTVIATIVCLSPKAPCEVWFNSPDLRSAAADLRDFLDEKGERPPQEKIAPPDAAYQPGDWVLADLSKDRSGKLGALLSAEDRASLEGGNIESFIAVNSNGVFYLIGGGRNGAVYASTRLQSAWNEGGENPIASESGRLKGKPAFAIRIGGAGGPNGESDVTQPFPNDYDWEAYARDLAHFGVNWTAGVLGGEAVPDDSLVAWGIRKILFVPANPFGESQLRTWRTSNREDLKPVQNTRSTGDDLSWSPCISSDFGKTVYKDWLNKLTQEHRSASSLVFFFSDWGAAPGEECAPGSGLAERVCEFLEEIEAIARSVAPDLKIYVSTRGFSAEDLRKILSESPPRVGVYFEEPSTSLLDDPATGYDPCIAASELDPVFEEILRETLESKQKETLVAVAAGDTDWLVSPAIGLPLPETAYNKLHTFAELGARNIALAMGGIHPWVYSPAAEVVKEVFWNTEEPYAELSARIASRDFGHLAENVRSAWSYFERAMDEMPSISRVQRLHRFVGSSNDSITGGGGVDGLEDRPWCVAVRDAAPFLLESIPATIESWEHGMDELQSAQVVVGENSYETAKRLRDTLFWGAFYLHLLEAQNNVLRALNLLSWTPDGQDPAKDPWRQAFLPIYRDEAANAQGWRDLLDTAPYTRIRIEKEVSTPAAFSRKMEQKQAALANLLGGE